MPGEVLRYDLKTANRSPDELLTRAIAAYSPQSIAIGQVVEYLYVVPAHSASHYAVGKPLPEIIVCTDATQTFFPETGPFRQIEIEKMYAAVFRVFLDPRLYRSTVALAGQHPQFEIPRHLKHPMPPNTDLATKPGLTCVCRDENFQS